MTLDDRLLFPGGGIVQGLGPSDHVDAFLDAIPDMIDGEVMSARYDVSSVDGEPVVDEVKDIAPLVLADNITVH